MDDHACALGAIARHRFEVMRGCGNDCRELLHDGHPDGVHRRRGIRLLNAFTAHVNVGFFRGAEIADPRTCWKGPGSSCHVKLRPDGEVDTTALRKLIEVAYADMRRRVRAERGT